MANFEKYDVATILEVSGNTSGLLNLKVSRPDTLRFSAGQFLMAGFEIDNRLLMKAYSIASSIYADYIEFLCRIIPDGKMSKILKEVKPGQHIILNKKPTGTLLVRDLNDGDNMYLLATGTGVAPFLSIIQDVDTYKKFKSIEIWHSSRHPEEAMHTQIDILLYDNPLISTYADQFRYHMYLTANTEFPAPRITTVLNNMTFDNNKDRFMICGNPQFNKDVVDILTHKGFKPSPHMGSAGDFLTEKAFVS